MPIRLPKDVRKRIVDRLKEYFREERDEELGDLSAGLLLDFFLEQAGPAIYNQAIADAHAFLSERLEDLFGLEKPQAVERR
jgi:uncharacterized protein (DUF2164 family)